MGMAKICSIPCGMVEKEALLLSFPLRNQISFLTRGIRSPFGEKGETFYMFLNRMVKSKAFSLFGLLKISRGKYVKIAFPAQGRKIDFSLNPALWWV